MCHLELLIIVGSCSNCKASCDLSEYLNISNSKVFIANHSLNYTQISSKLYASYAHFKVNEVHNFCKPIRSQLIDSVQKK